MSYNATNIELAHRAGFCISREKLVAVSKKLEELGVHPPDSTFLDDDWRAWAPVLGESNCYEEAGFIFPRRFRWCGEGSGYTWDAFVEVALPAFDGTADLVITWEGGDSFSGLRLRDGKVTKHKIVMTLGDELKD